MSTVTVNDFMPNPECAECREHWGARGDGLVRNWAHVRQPIVEEAAEYFAALHSEHGGEG